jgi:hypothetical protein
MGVPKLMILLLFLATACKSHAVRSVPDLTRKDLDPIIKQKSASDRLLQLTNNTVCYRYIIDGKALPRCLCIHGNDDLVSTSEMTCVYPFYMQIPIRTIEMNTETPPPAE